MIRFQVPIETDYDVMIIGAGPAGASCAAHLAASGLKVLLLDSKVFPRDKVCGDFVSPVSIRELEKIGVAQREEFQRANIIRRAALSINGRQSIRQEFPEIDGLPSYGRVIPRMLLDNWIVDEVKIRQVQVIENARLEHYQIHENAVICSISHNGQTVHLTSKLLIGADGSTSTVARILRNSKTLPDDLIIGARTYFQGIHAPEDEAELYFSTENFPGYTWLFPSGNGGANIGTGILFKTIPESKVSLNEMLETMVLTDPLLKEHIGEGKMTHPIRTCPLSTYNPENIIHGHRLLLIGDAAGLINPLNGEGIQYALLSGRWAAELIKACGKDYSGEVLQTYRKKIDHELNLDMALSLWIIQLIRNKSLNPLWLRFLDAFASQAKNDKKYADIAGGILAGMLPSSNALSAGFLFSTVMQCALTMGESFIQFIRTGNTWQNPAVPGLETNGELLKMITGSRVYFPWIKGSVEQSVVLLQNFISTGLQDISRSLRDRLGNIQE